MFNSPEKQFIEKEDGLSIKSNFLTIILWVNAHEGIAIMLFSHSELSIYNKHPDQRRVVRLVVWTGRIIW